jgi:DNA polymerase I-like protein with 3'-5' exonuclease and polymerase domains
MCKEPNLQQIPKRDKISKRIRRFFCPPSEDYYLGEFDAAGFQLRIGAALSGDDEMFRVFTELGGDMHSMTAVSVLQRNLLDLKQKQSTLDLSLDHQHSHLLEMFLRKNGLKKKLMLIF